MLTIPYACHTAYLDPMTGSGLLVLPDHRDDVSSPMPLGETLHGSDWTAVMVDLHRRGWEPTEADDGGVMYEADTPTGHPVIGLYGNESIIDRPSLDQIAEAFRTLRLMVDSA